MLAALVLSLLSLIVPVRPRLRGQTVAKPTTTKKEEDFRLPLTLGENYSALAAMT